MATVAALEARIAKAEKERAALAEELGKEKRARFVLESMLNNGGGTTASSSAISRELSGGGFQETASDASSEYSDSASGAGGGVGVRHGAGAGAGVHASDMQTIAEYEDEEQQQERAELQADEVASDERMARVADDESARKPEEDNAFVEDAASGQAAQVPAVAEDSSTARPPEEDAAAIDEAAEQKSREVHEEPVRKPEDDRSNPTGARTTPATDTEPTHSHNGAVSAGESAGAIPQALSSQPSARVYTYTRKYYIISLFYI